MAWLGKSLSECTWEQVSTLPASLVTEFEKGATFDVVDSTSQSGGQALHTLSPSAYILTTPSPAKRPRANNPVARASSTNTG